MKIVYFNSEEEKLFELNIFKLKSIDDDALIKDVPLLKDEYIKMLSYLVEEIFIFVPIDDGKDFYLRYLNHLNYFDSEDNNFKIGSRLSKTIARYDKEKNLLNMLTDIYKTGEDRNGIVKYLTNDGKLLKSLDYHYFMMNGSLIAVHDDKSEVRMYREMTLNNEDFGIAILQNNKFVELNDNYAKCVHKTREQMLGVPQDFKGMPEETIRMIKREVGLITKQKKLSYKAPVVSYDENGDINYYMNAEGSYIVYDNMPAVLFKIKDLTEQEKAKRAVGANFDNEVYLDEIVNELDTSSKTFISYAIYPDKFGTSDNFYDVIEDDSRTYSFKKNTLRDFVIGEDLALYDYMIASLSPINPEVEFVTSIMTLKFNIKYIKHYFKRIYDSEGYAKSYVSAHRDITEEASYSNALKKQLSQKDEIIHNKEIQIKEAHHTIKNNLNILISLIRMEEHNHKNAEEIVEETKSHLKAISVMHENLYQSKTLQDLEMKGFIDSIVESLFEIYSSDITYVSDIDDIILNIDQASTLGLIINELINNTVKYAFPDGNAGTVTIKLSRVDTDIDVEYRDSGVGIPDSVDFDNPSSLGLTVIKNLSKQIDGTIKYEYDNGACFKLSFKELKS